MFFVKFSRLTLYKHLATSRPSAVKSSVKYRNETPSSSKLISKLLRCTDKHVVSAHRSWPSVRHWIKLPECGSSKLSVSIATAKNSRQLLKMLSENGIADAVSSTKSSEECTKAIAVSSTKPFITTVSATKHSLPADEQFNIVCSKSLLRNMTFRVYIELKQLPVYNAFLKRDIHAAFKQVRSQLTGEETDTKACPVASALDTVLEKNGDGDAEIGLLMTYLGMSTHSAIYRHNYLTARQRVHDMTWWDVSCMVSICDALGVDDYVLYRSVLKRIHAQCTDAGSDKLSYSDACSILTTIARMPTMLLSPTLAHDVIEWMTSLINDDNSKFMTSSTEHFCVWCEAAAVVFRCASDASRLLLEKSVIKLNVYTHAQRSNFSLYEIDRVMRALTGVYPATAPHLFQLYDYVYVDDVNRYDVSDLLVACAHLERTNEHAGDVGSRIKHVIIDKLTRPSLVTSLCGGSSSGGVGPSYASLVDYDVIVKVLSLGSLPAKLRQTLRLLCMLNLQNVNLDFVRSNQEKEAVKRRDACKTARHLLESAAVTNRMRCMYLGVLLANADSPLSLADYAALMENFDVQCFTTLLAVAIKQNVTDGRFLTKDKNISFCVRKLSAALSLRSRKRSWRFDDVFPVLYTLVFVPNHHKQAMNFISELYRYLETRVAHDVSYLTSANQVSLAHNLALHKHYSPKLFDYIAEQTLCTNDDVTSVTDYYAKRVERVLMVCGMFEYKPAMVFDVLLREAERALRHTMQQQHYKTALSILLHMAHFDVFPEQVLTELFTNDDTYRTVLEYCSTRNDRFACIVSLNTLNRKVASLRPSLAIPMRGTAEKFSDGDVSASSRAVMNSMYKTLVGICGGAEFVKDRHRSASVDGHMDFLVRVCSSTGKPFPVAESNSASGDCRQVALLALDRAVLASNDNSVLLSGTRARVRILTADGYDVIVLIRNNWHLNEAVKVKKLTRMLFRKHSNNDKRNKQYDIIL